jgi:glutathione S-transferase
MNESIVLGYWGIRGRGQVSRHLLCYTKADFTEKKYASQDQWKGIGKDQSTLGLSFPNLPYLIQGDFKIT